MRAMLLARVGVREQECIHAVEHALLQVMKPLHHNSPPKLSRGTKKKKKKGLLLHTDPRSSFSGWRGCSILLNALTIAPFPRELVTALHSKSSVDIRQRSNKVLQRKTLIARAVGASLYTFKKSGKQKQKG